MNIDYVADVAALAEKGAKMFAQAMRESVRLRSRFLVALAGGNTPRPVYERLTKTPYGDALPWNETLLYFGDERMVPCDSPQSNYRMACETLLDHVDIPAWNLYRIHGEENVVEAARLYDRKLRRLTAAGEALPRFDLILLGLGDDGHTASLFPGTAALSNTTDMAAPVHLPASSAGAEQARERVTVTYPVLNAARQVLFLVAGDDKADPMRKVEAGDQSAPATRVRPAAGTVHWLVVRASG